MMILLLGVSLLVPVAVASGQDFTNNLFSDLAPLLALFGENFAHQFLSESFTWLDHIIFAMAPLGIITAIVGAIRVGGPTWLKAVVGRARETRASAEVELMSSTSHEVCELWNGEAIVRTMGEPVVQQIVYLEDCPDDFGLYTCSVAEGEKIMKHDHQGPFTKVYRYIKQRFSDIIDGPTPREHRKQSKKLEKRPANNAQENPQEDEIGDVGETYASSKDTATETPSTQSRAPNISLNLPVRRHSQATWDLYVVATIGIVLQTGVLVFSSYTAYSASLRKKVGGPAGAYAFPLLAAGTILLVIAMVICSAVIDSSTNEVIWERAILEKTGDTHASEPSRHPSNEMRVFWLQRKHVVGDSSFDSFLIMARGKRTRILNSRRVDESARSETKEINDDSSFKDLEDFEENNGGKYSFGTILQYLVVIGVFTGLSGFVLQFEGFRGLSWSCSIAQLVAILIMTTLRAYVRRGLLRKPYTKAVPFEHEMDWLALKIGFNDDFFDRDGNLESFTKENEPNQVNKSLTPKEPKSPPQLPPYSKWDVVCRPESPAIHGELLRITVGQGEETEPEAEKGLSENLEPTLEGEKINIFSNSAEGAGITLQTPTLSPAEKVVGVRRRLGQLTSWANPVSELAISIAKSVEIVMNQFFRDSKMNRFTWQLEVNIAPKQGHESKIKWDSSKLSFIARRDPKRGWKTDSTYIEAVLSLWMFRTNKAIRTQTSRLKKDEKNEDWLRSTKAGVTGSFYQVLGPDTKTLRNDISWWIGDHARLALEDKIIYDADKFNLIAGFVGYDKDKYVLNIKQHEKSSHSRHASVSTSRLSRHNTRDEDDQPPEPDKFDGFLCLSSTAETEEFLAQYIFSSFMWAVSKYIPKQKLGSSEVDTHAAERFNFMDQNWHDVKIINKTIQDVARSVTDTGLGTLPEIYLVLIPPLSVASKLPNEAIVEMVRRKAKDNEQRHRWREAASGYKKLLELYEKSEVRDQFTYKGVAAVIDFLVTTSSIPLPDDMETNDEEMSFNEAKEVLCNKLTSDSFRSISSDIRNLYVNQGRDKDYDKAMSWSAKSSERQQLSALDFRLFGYTKLHNFIVNNMDSDEYFDTKQFGEDWYSSDILGWTPFHYSVNPRCKLISKIKVDEMNTERIYKMRDSANRTLLDHVLMKGMDGSMVKTFIGVYSALGLEPGRDGLLSLHWAAVGGHGKTIVSLLEHEMLRKEEKEMLVRQGDFWGRTALHLAASHGHDGTVTDLLTWAEGASIEKILENEVDNKGRTALHLAAAWGWVDSVGALLAHRPWDKVTAQDKSGCTVLHLAIERYQDDVVRKIVECLGEDVGNAEYWKFVDLRNHEKEDYGYIKETALEIAQRLEEDIQVQLDDLQSNNKNESAVEENATDEEEQLISPPPDDSTVYTVQQAAEVEIDPKKTEVLKKREVDMLSERSGSKGSTMDPKDKKKALQENLASIESIFKSLLQGENKNPQEAAKRLLWSVTVESKAAFKVLTQKGVKGFARGEKDKRSILHIEAERGSVDRIKVILELWKKNKDANKTDNKDGNKEGDQETTLKPTTNAPRKLSVSSIQSRDFSPKDSINAPQNVPQTLAIEVNRKDFEDQTALAIAAASEEKEAKEIVTILFNAGAEIGLTDNEGRNALHRAARNVDSSIFLWLLEKATETEVNAMTTSGSIPLMEAIDNEQPENAIALLELEKFKSRLNLEGRYSDKRTLLGMASWRGHDKVVQILLEKGADRTETDVMKDTPLHEACWRGHQTVAELLLDEKFLSTTVGPKNETAIAVDPNKEIPTINISDEPFTVDPAEKAPVAERTVPALYINSKNEAGRTPLFYAVLRGQDSVAELLLEKGAEADEKDNSNESILGCAAREKEEKAFLMVLEKTTNINVVNDSNQTPILWLIRNNMEEAATALLNLEEEVNLETHPDHMLGPLHEAIRRCSDSLVIHLLSKKANVLETDFQGRTGLHMAAASGRLPILKSMLEQRLDCKRTLFDAEYNDKQGRNVLHHASCNGDVEVGQYLLQELNGGTVINKPDNDGWTPLHWAAKSGREELFSLLLAHGANPIIKEALNNETVLQLLQRYDYKSLVERLPAMALEYGKTIATSLKRRPTAREWPSVECDGCLLLIRGSRFKCQDCDGIWEGFDFCEKCVKSSAETHPEHRFSEEKLEVDSDSEDDYTAAVERRRRRRAERAQRVHLFSGTADFT